MGKEAKIEKAVCDYAESLGLEHRKLKWDGRRDAPDRIFWGPGVPPFFIEFKAPGEEPRKGQIRELQRLNLSAPGTAWLVDSEDEGKNIIRAKAASGWRNPTC